MAALTIMAAVTVLLVILMCGVTTTAAQSTARCWGANCAACNGRLCKKCQRGYFLGPTSCQKCAPDECASDQYEAHACDGVFNTYCKTCTKGACPSGQYESAPCSATKNRVCSACGCGKGQYWSGGGGCLQGTANYNCTTCTKCTLPQQYLKTPCGSARDTVCGNCSESCGTGFYVSSPCKSTADRTCAACRVCPKGTYKTDGCNGTVDSICTKCTVECPHGQYITTPCNSTHNAICEPCDNCTAGTYFEIVQCDGINNRQCKACSTDPCPDGYYVSSPCTSTSDRQCSACGCADDEFIPTTDGTCGPGPTGNYNCTKCKACPPGEYLANGCTSLVDGDCKQCTTCDPGFVVKSPCTPKSNRVCEKRKPTRPKPTLLQICKNKFAQRIRLGLRCQRELCKNVPSYRRLYDCSRVLPRFGLTG